MILNKGDCVLIGNWWYVVVKDLENKFSCVCDNANNSYVWDKDEIEFHLSARDAVHAHAYGLTFHLPKDISESLEERIINREIPVDVIAEALVGLHDDRS